MVFVARKWGAAPDANNVDKIKLTRSAGMCFCYVLFSYCW